jgi:hypothetical protein
MSRYCKHGIDPMHCAADECQLPAKSKAQGPLDAAACSLVESQLAETLSKLRWLIHACETQAERTGQESIHLRSARIKCKQWVECFPANETAHLTAEKGGENEK